MSNSAVSHSGANDTADGWLCLADGTAFPGRIFGTGEIAIGEVVFTTGMTGYQEVLSDPSYRGQIVTMTAAHVGNTGCNHDDHESRDNIPHVSGFVVRAFAEHPSNYRSTETLDAYLKRHRITALADVDTRALTTHIRTHGAQMAAIGRGDRTEVLNAARSARPLEERDLVAEVSPSEPYQSDESSGPWLPRPRPGQVALPPASSEHRHVVAIDFGAKRNILRCLVDVGCRVTAVPATTSAADILALNPDGIFLSNGPGDPAAVTYAIDTIRQLLGKRPIFGICLGHQLLALAAGGTTYKLKFGHRGINQPIKDLETGRIEIATENHGFAVNVDTLGGRARVTHTHLNDGTNEGLTYTEWDAFGVQFHPEASAGPHDSMYLFDRFVQRIDAARRARTETSS